MLEGNGGGYIDGMGQGVGYDEVPQGYQQAEGIVNQGGIDYSSPPDFNRKRLTGLGFTVVDIRECEMLFNRGAKFTPSFLQNMCGYDYDTAKRLKYLYDIAQGKITIDTDDELVKHLKKMFKNKRRVTIFDLPKSDITEVPKLCAIGEVTAPMFKCYNSALYPPNKRFYRVVAASKTRVIISTKRRPEIKFRGPREVEGVAKVVTPPENVIPNAPIEVSFDPKYVRLCNRYIVLASTARPELHLGGYEIIVVDGSKVYVYARIVPADKDLKYKAAKERVLDKGIYPGEIAKRVENAARLVHKRLAGVKANKMEATSEFDLFKVEGAEYGMELDTEVAESPEIDLDFDI